MNKSSTNAAALRIREARDVLEALALPREQRNDRSALCLLGLLGLTPEKKWREAANPLMGITPLMDFSRDHYGIQYAPNTRETFRRQTMHQFVQAGIALYNPDKPNRPVNSPKAVYQITPEALGLIKVFQTDQWDNALQIFFKLHQSLTGKYAQPRQMNLVPISLLEGTKLELSPGNHSLLLKAIVEEFAPRYAPGGHLIYLGDTGEKHAFFDEKFLASLGIEVDPHGKMPDAILHDPRNRWLLLIEAVTSHGPMNAKRHEELTRLFASSTEGLVFVTAFPDRATLAKHIANIAWETEVWVADAPDHLIHFDGERYLGPYGA
ncbi:MAG TPA: restriction endonuclease [Syntrophaceae bacterium]|nr:restriction endonuclease [Syntrophaceae bacterium]